MIQDMFDFNLKDDSSKFLKFVEVVQKKRELFLFGFYVSLLIIFLGFFLLSFPEIEQFFGENRFLFYILTFLPICLSILSFIVLILMGTFLLLYDKYKRMKSQSDPFYKMIIQILLLFCIIIFLIGFVIYSDALSWPKNMSNRK